MSADKCPACDGACVLWVDDMLEPCAECDGTGRAVVVSPMAVEALGMATIDGVPMPATKIHLSRPFMVFDVASDDEGSAEE